MQDTIKNVTNAIAGEFGAVWAMPYSATNTLSTITTDNATEESFLALGLKYLGTLRQDAPWTDSAPSVSDNSQTIMLWQAPGFTQEFRVGGSTTDTKQSTATFAEAKNLDMLRIIYGTDNVIEPSGAGDTVITDKGINTQDMSIVVVFTTADGYKAIFIYERVRLTRTGDIVLVDNDIISYPVTIDQYVGAQLQAYCKMLYGRASVAPPATQSAKATSQADNK